MRIIAFVAVLALSTPAFADSFADVVGGISLPLANDTWTKTADTSPKIGLRAGAIGEVLGGLLAVDFSPESIPNSSGSIGSVSGSFSMFRFRILAELVAQHRFSVMTLEARAGGGIDIAHDSASGSIGTISASSSGTDVGYAIEVGGDAWFDVGRSLQLGGQVALPIGHHDSSDGGFGFNWTSYELDILVGVRFRSRSK